MSDEKYTQKWESNPVFRLWDGTSGEKITWEEIQRLRTENTSMREIVQAVAIMKWNLKEDWCLFCNSTLWQDEPENHTPNCPVTRARDLVWKASEYRPAAQSVAEEFQRMMEGLGARFVDATDPSGERDPEASE